MIKPFLILLLLAPAARAQFKPFNAPAQQAPAIDFCASGKFAIFAGSCTPGGKRKDVISAKACNSAAETLYDGISYLYPNAKVEFYENLTPDEIMERLARPLILGFVFVGEGDTKGGFITGPERQRLYPDVGPCSMNAFDLIAGITSHSKYSPEYPARKADTGNVISRQEIIYDGALAMPGSWTKLCKPKLGLVYPTRTFAGRIKDDVKKFIGVLQDEKKKHVLKTLGDICDNCQGHIAAGNNLAQLCPPNSNVCRLRKIVPGSEQLILDNYCSALAPTAKRAE